MCWPKKWYNRRLKKTKANFHDIEKETDERKI
jgi:hypothetical protein